MARCNTGERVRGCRIKTEVILRRSDARWAQAAGIAQAKNPVSFQRFVRTVQRFMHFLFSTGSFTPHRPAACARADAPLRMTPLF